MSKLVPEGWNVFSLGEFCDEKSIKFDGDTSIPVLSVTKYEGFVSSLNYFNKQVFSRDLSSYKIVRSGQFAYATIHLDEGSLGLLTDFDSGLISPMYTVFETSDVCDAKYLFYLLKSDNYMQKYPALGQGSINRRMSISFRTLSSLQVCLPPIEEQKKIASILTSVDEVIENTQKQIEKLEDLKKATMHELLTKGIGHTEFKESELGRIPESWEVYELGTLCTFTQGVQIPLDETLRANRQGYIRYLYINDFSSDKNLRFVKDEFPTKIVTKADLVMANTGHSAGTIFRGKNGVLSNNAFKITITKNVRSEYLFQFLSTENYWLSIRKLFNTAGQPHVGHGNIAKLQFLCPPLDEQDKIMAVIHKIDKNISDKFIKLSQTQALKKSLMQDLLTGKVRVQVH